VEWKGGPPLFSKISALGMYIWVSEGETPLPPPPRAVCPAFRILASSASRGGGMMIIMIKPSSRGTGAPLAHGDYSGTE
jgi:hypothetical protein